MRHSGTAKQRLWLGPGGYRRRCRDTVTNSDAESYAIANSFTCRMRAVGNTNTNSHGYGHGYAFGHAGLHCC
jgi:hypothetical protein